MGYLTTFTIYNDGAHMLKELTAEQKDKLINDLHDACFNSRFATKTYSVNGFVNMINSQRARHADDHTVYVHMGNCLVNMNPWEKEFKENAKRSLELYKQMHKYLKSEVKKIGEVLKEIEKGDQNGKQHDR